jgi:cob(I)alamin adenosyltransferase
MEAAVTRIYTRNGDDGTTALIGGSRVSKDSERLDAYGTVDELNSWLGLIRSHPLPDPVDTILQRVQNDLFTVGAGLAVPDAARAEELGVPILPDAAVGALELDIDRCEAELKPLNQFILPGGAPSAALLHLSRTVARRAERCCVALARTSRVPPSILRYLNRLSDLCFVLARFINARAGRPEPNPTFEKPDSR